MAQPNRRLSSRSTSSRTEVPSSSTPLGSLAPPTGSPATQIENTLTTHYDTTSMNDRPSFSLQEDSQLAENEEAIMSSQEDMMPAVAPFFTMIEDLTTGSHYHPEVHYIFSDDEGDVLIDSIQQIEELHNAQEAKIQRRRNSRSDSLTGAGPTAQSAIPQERYIIVDLDADGKAIVSAHSLTNDWQVLDASISEAPELDPGGAIENEDDRVKTLMLRIDGTGEIGSKKYAVPAANTTGQAPSIEDEVRGFNMRMAELGKVVERAEKDFLLPKLAVEAQESKA